MGVSPSVPLTSPSASKPPNATVNSCTSTDAKSSGNTALGTSSRNGTPAGANPSMCSTPAISVSVNGSPGAISSVVRLSAGDFDAPGHALVDEQQAAVLDLDAVDVQLHGLRHWDRRAWSPPRPCQLRAAVGAPHEAQVGALEDHAVGDQLAAQQRNELSRRVCALFQETMGSGPKPGALPKLPSPVRSAEPGKEAELDVTDQREFAAGGVADAPLRCST